MKKYKIISHDTLEQLEALVNDEVEDGYTPIGGIMKEKYYVSDTKYFKYSQAVTMSNITVNIDTTGHVRAVNGVPIS